LEKDFAELANEFESKQRDQIIQKSVALRPVERVYQALQDQRNTQRTSVAGAPSDVALGTELARLDSLVAAVETELNKLRSDRSKIEVSLADGEQFFATVIKAVEAWASAHADLIKAFEQNRVPNLVVLAARAEELKEIVGKLKK
jgi:hypothetical protein